MLTRCFFVILLYFTSCFTTNAKEVSLDVVSAKILQNSNAKQSADYSLLASKQQQKQAEKHFLPNIYIDNSTYQTNDPTRILMGNLYQRSVAQNDFSPNNINLAQTQNYSRSSVGVIVPLFEGFGGLANAKIAKYNTISKHHDLQYVKLSQYSRVLEIYTSIVSLTNYQKKLNEIMVKIAKIKAEYSIGSKQNPIGHSGLLILTALDNKLSSLIQDSKYKTAELYNSLMQMGFDESNWSVLIKDVDFYLQNYFNITAPAGDSLVVSSFKEQVNIGKAGNVVARSAHLPHFNGFAEGYSFSGNRAIKNGYIVGINAKWNLLDKQTYLNTQIAKNNTNALKYHLAAMQQNEQIEFSNLESQIKSLNNTLNLDKQNQQLMLENIQTSLKLFHNGSINAIFLADAFNRYIDVLINSQNTELSLINLSAKKLTLQNINIDNIKSL